MSRNPLAVRRTLQRIVPGAVWLLVAGLAYWLYTGSAGSGQARGLAEVKEFTVSAIETGQIASLNVALGQCVRRGDVIATLDAGLLEREIAVAEAELRELEAQVPAEGKSIELRRLQTERAFQAELEEAEIETRTARASYATDQAELTGLREEFARQADLVRQRLASTDRMKDIEMRLAALEESVAGWPPRIEALDQRERAARERLSEWRSTNAGTSRRSARHEQLRPLELRILKQHETLELLEKRLARMVLRAPADAHVVNVLARQGSVVTPGDPVVVLVEEAPRKVIAYVDEERAFPVSVGDKATLRRPDQPGRGVEGAVVHIGATVAEIPPRFWPNRLQARWGREVFIKVDRDHNLDPGEAFDITFNQNAAALDLARPVSAATNASPSEPVPLSVPSSIAARSRFEPSGLLWVDGLRRYLIVSDDTGLESADDNAPWLFTMDERGVVDPAPRSIAGLGAVNDIEAITAAPDGAIYLISSQSLNRNGKRKPARTLFVRARLRGDKLHAEGAVSFYDLLLRDLRDDPSLRSSLGLGRDAMPEFEIEGLAWHADALFLGLKNPKDSAGKALIWRLEQPDGPFENGSLVGSGLDLWNKVRLDVGGEGAGISELLFLGDDSLVIAATNEAGGALFHCNLAVSENPHTETLAVWPGLKPEGLSLSPSRDQLVVAFDRQQETPAWTHMETP